MKTKNKLKTLKQLKKIVSVLKRKHKRLVFTNGCFDILHYGHIKYLQAARNHGDILILGLNSDRSAKKIKGRLRPIITQTDRVGILSCLSCVDFIVLFDAINPLSLIKAIKPDVLIKGADWKVSDIVGSNFVRSYGGDVRTISYLKGRSTSKMIKKIVRRYG